MSALVGLLALATIVSISIRVGRKMAETSRRINAEIADIALLRSRPGGVER